MLPLAVAVKVVIAGALAKPMLRVPLAALIKLPAPERAVLTVKASLLVSAIAEESVAIAIVPLSAWVFVLNVAVPVKATDPLVRVIPPWKTPWVLAPSRVPPLTVTRPVKVLVLVSPVKVKVPEETVVVPPTEKVWPLAVIKVPPFTNKFPEMAVAADKVQDPAVMVALVIVVAAQVFVPLPLKVKL